jgi:hypothetical protein
MRNIRKSRTLCLGTVLAAVSAFAQQPAARIVVGPNILASPNEDYRHHETMLAANPTDPKNLIATSITESRPGHATATQTYVSADGGYSWVANKFPEQMEPDLGFGGGDPEVAFGPTGTAYFLYLGGVMDRPGKRVDAFFFYRSEDGGKHWLPRIQLPSCDHPQIVVDQTKSKFRGNIYVSTLTHKNGKRIVGIFRSTDDGRSFEGPIVAAVAKDGIQSNTPVVLSDGTLCVPYIEFEVKPPSYGELRPISYVVSTDGGRTFSSPQPIAIQHTYAGHEAEHEAGRRDPNAFPKLGYSFDWTVTPTFAADWQGTDSRRDRIYAVWPDVPPQAKSRLLFSYSTDKGKSWTAPRPLSPEVPANAYQFQPGVAVNNRGVLGVQWFDTRDSAKQDSYDLYFTASVDGGASFLPAKRVTSVPSFPAARGNMRLEFAYGDNAGAFDGKSESLAFHNGYVNHSNGGDYMLFQADSSGVFHPFWTDLRMGTRQLWTAQVRVEDGMAKHQAAPAGAVRDVTKDVLVVGGPIEFDSSTNQATIELRLKNISDRALAPPFSVTVSSLEWTAARSAGGMPTATPEILNSANGKAAAGATFDYSGTLRDLDQLSPGEITDPLPWRIQLDSWASNFKMKLQVTASGTP